MKPSLNDLKDQRFYFLFFNSILGLSALLRFPYMMVERLWPDEALYAWNAKRIFLHPELIFSKEVMDFHPPLFSFILSLGHFFFSPLSACHGIVFLINVLGVVAIYALGVRIQGRFLGCFCALALAFNLQYFNMSSLIIIDGVLAVVTIVFFYVLSRIQKRKVSRWDFCLRFTIMAMILLKWSAGLILPFLFLYYMLAFEECTFRQRLVKSAIPLFAGVMTIAVLIWHNHSILGEWIPKVFSQTNESYREPFYFYYDHLTELIIQAPLLPFFILGLWLTLRSSDRNLLSHGLWIIFAFIAMSMMPSKDFRFMLPIIPSMILVAGLGAEAVLSKIEKSNSSFGLAKKLFLMAFLSYFIFVYFPTIEQNATRKAYGYVGFSEAGGLVRDLISHQPQAAVVASSPRMVRYFTGINLHEFQGRLFSIPDTEDGFKKMISENPTGIILVVDQWELAQPKWIFPLTTLNARFLKEQGFSLLRIVEKEVLNAQDVLERKPVIWIFQKPGSSI